MVLLLILGGLRGLMEISGVCGGGAGTMDEPWCVFIGCYDSSFSNYRLFVNIICQLDGGVVIILTTSDPIICIVYKLHCVCVCVCVC